MQPRKLLLVFLSVVLVAGTAAAQPNHANYWSLEARLAAAEAVVIGPILDEALAQYEPEFYTAVREFLKARDSTPADVSNMMSIVLGYYRHRHLLQAPWTRRLLTHSRLAAVVNRQGKLAELFDAFEDALAAGEKGKKRATTFFQLHEELLGRKTPQQEIEKAAAAYHEWLGKLAQAKRDLVKEFGREMKTGIKKLAEAEGKPAKNTAKTMLECRVIVKETATVGYPNEVALLEVELKNVSDKAIAIRYTFAPAILQYMRREDQLPDGTIVKGKCVDSLSPDSAKPVILTLKPGQASKAAFGSVGVKGPGYRVEATFAYENLKAVSPILEVALKAAKK